MVLTVFYRFVLIIKDKGKKMPLPVIELLMIFLKNALVVTTLFIGFLNIIPK